MRRIRTTLIACLALVAGPGSAWAFVAPDMTPVLPTEHQLEARYAQNTSQPYAMTYSDEAARRLGVEDGKWEAFHSRPSDPLMPSLRGGIDRSGAMISLQWLPGQ
jgi:hypothetical protein